MRWFAFVLCLMLPGWGWAENIKDLLDNLDGKVVDFAGKMSYVNPDGSYIMLSGGSYFLISNMH